MSIVLGISTRHNLMLIKLLQLDFTTGILTLALALAVTGLLLDLAAGAIIGTVALPFVALAAGMVLALVVGEFNREIRTQNINHII